MEHKKLSKVAGFLTLFLAVFAGISKYLASHQPLLWQISGAGALLLLVAFFVLQIRPFKEALKKRTVQFGVQSVFTAIVALVAVVVINMIANEYDVKLDATKNKLNTLSEQSVKIVQSLSMPITLRAFVLPNQVEGFRRLFEKYSYHSKQLKVDFVDVDKDPLAVKRYGIKQAGTIVVESETRNSKIEDLFSGTDDPKIEEKITNAIISVAKGEKKKIYFVTGHGEKSISENNPSSVSELKESLEQGRYKVEALQLLDKKEVPGDADLLVFAGPQSDFMDHELSMLEAYLKNGGHVFLMLEPSSTPTLVSLLNKYGIKWAPKKAILETNQVTRLAGGNPLAPIVTSYTPSHQITRDSKELSIFPISTPVETLDKKPENIEVVSLFSTSPQSFEVAFLGDKVKVDQKKDRKGPLSLAVAVTGKVETPKVEEKKDTSKPESKEAEKAKQFRLVVVGDSDFASNNVKRFGGNSDLVQNTLSWLSGEEDLISIRPKALDESKFDITEARYKVIFLSSVLVAPIAFLLSGLLVWLTRRAK